MQISGKGLKLIQTVPTMSRSGKMKMQMIKFQISANCITYSMTGRAPFDDVVGVVMLVLNPEMHCPMHVHCYRCDSPDTAAILQANLQVCRISIADCNGKSRFQILIGRPETQRAILDLEQRLYINGLLVPRPRRLPPPASASPQDHRGMPKQLFDELKHRISLQTDLTPPQVLEKFAKGQAYVFQAPRHRPHPRSSVAGSHLDLSSMHALHHAQQPADQLRKRYSISEAPSTWRGGLPDFNAIPEPRVRLFGDTIVRTSNKSMSMENLTGVSRLPDAG